MLAQAAETRDGGVTAADGTLTFARQARPVGTERLGKAEDIAAAGLQRRPVGMMGASIDATRHDGRRTVAKAKAHRRRIEISSR